MDAKTEELRAAHDVLAEFYAGRLADALDRMPAERAVLGLFCDLTLAAGPGTSVDPAWTPQAAGTPLPGETREQSGGRVGDSRVRSE
jgi:hypothetical protein